MVVSGFVLYKTPGLEIINVASGEVTAKCNAVLDSNAMALSKDNKKVALAFGPYGGGSNSIVTYDLQTC